MILLTVTRDRDGFPYYQCTLSALRGTLMLSQAWSKFVLVWPRILGSNLLKEKKPSVNSSSNDLSKFKGCIDRHPGGFSDF